MDESEERRSEGPRDETPRDDRGGDEARPPRDAAGAPPFGGGDIDRRRRRGRRGRGGQRFGAPRGPLPQRGPAPVRDDEESSQARELAAYERRQAQQQQRRGPGGFRGPGWVPGARPAGMPGSFRPQGRPMGGARGPRRAVGGAQYSEQIRRATAGPRSQAAPSHEAGEPIAGPHAVLEAIRAGRQVKRLYISNERGTRTGPVNDLITEAQSRRVFVRFVDVREIERLSPVENHQGVLAIVEGKAGVELEEFLLHLDALSEPALVLVIDSLQDPQNFGVLLRSAEGAGADGVIIPRHRAVGLTPAVARTSSGASEHLMIADVPNLRQAIDALKEKGVWVVGTDESGDLLYDEVDYRGATAIVVGGEAEGIRRLVLEGCDQVVRIPMQGQVASLNAASAGTVVLYEALRQRMRNAAPSATRTPPPPRAAPVMPSEEDMNDADVEAMGRTDEDDLGDEDADVMPPDEGDESPAPVTSDMEPEDETAVTEEAVPETADAVTKPKKRTARKTAAPRKTTRKKTAE